MNDHYRSGEASELFGNFPEQVSVMQSTNTSTIMLQDVFAQVVGIINFTFTSFILIILFSVMTSLLTCSQRWLIRKISNGDACNLSVE